MGACDDSMFLYFLSAGHTLDSLFRFLIFRGLHSAWLKPFTLLSFAPVAFSHQVCISSAWVHVQVWVGVGE